MTIQFEKVRDKFEAWAIEHGFNLTRHPNDNDFYFNKDVSMLFVCFATGYTYGSEDQMNSFADELKESLIPSVQEVLIDRALHDDDWGDEESQRRMDIIAQNGNTADHYK